MDNHLKGLKDEKKLFEDVYKKYQTLEGEIDAKLRKRVNQGINNDEMEDWEREVKE